MALGLQTGEAHEASPGMSMKEHARSSQIAVPSETVEISRENPSALLESNARAVRAQAERLPADPLWRNYYAEGVARAERELTRLFENPTSTQELKKQLRSLTGFEQDAAFITEHLDSKEMRATLLTLRLARAAKAIELISAHPGPDASTLMLSVLAANRPADLSVASSIRHSGWLFGVGRGNRDAVVAAMEANPGTVRFGSGTDAGTISLANVARFDLAVGAGRLAIPVDMLSDFQLRSVVRRQDGTLLSCMAIGSGCEANANEITFKNGHAEDASAFPLVGPGTEPGAAEELSRDDARFDYWLEKDIRIAESTSAQAELDKNVEEEVGRILAMFTNEGGGASSGGKNGPFVSVSDGSGKGIERLVRVYRSGGLQLPIDVSPNVPRSHYAKLADALNAAEAQRPMPLAASPTKGRADRSPGVEDSFRPVVSRSEPARSRLGVPASEEPSGPKPSEWKNPEIAGGVLFKDLEFPELYRDLGVGYRITLHPGSNSGPDDGGWSYDLDAIQAEIAAAERNPIINEAIRKGFRWNSIQMTRNPLVAERADEPTMNFHDPEGTLVRSLLKLVKAWNPDIRGVRAVVFRQKD